MIDFQRSTGHARWVNDLQINIGRLALVVQWQPSRAQKEREQLGCDVPRGFFTVRIIRVSPERIEK